MRPLSELAEQLDKGEVTSLALVEACLERILDPQGEGARAFTAIDADASRAQARAMDDLRSKGRAPSPLAGIPISVKCLFDIEGHVTTAGSKLLANNLPAVSDAEAVRRLRAAGLVVVGHTNMTEFAYSGLGINPHYGTPRNPFDREQGRIPGGSSSGAAISVTDNMAAAGLGTDTGGSCRIPAAFCGITGYKPTARRVPAEGAYPLSLTLDSIGPVARTVDCCARLDAILAADTGGVLETESSGLRLAVLDNYVTEGMSASVAAAFEDAIKALQKAGVRIERLRLPELERLPELNARGGIIAAEAYALHKENLARNIAAYDPRVSSRILKGATQHDGEYEALLEIRRQMIGQVHEKTKAFDAILFPTVPIQAPLLSEMDDEETYGRTNLLVLRNPTVGNFLDRCAISLPIPSGNGLPVGLMLMGEHMADRKLLGAAAAIEVVFGGEGRA